MREADPPTDSGVDAVLVGASAGSLLAATRLARAGLSVVLVEKASQIGGGTAYSGGIVWAPDNARMRAKGLQDSAEDGIRYLAEVDRGGGDPEAQTHYVRSVNDALQYVEEVTTLQWVSYPGLPDYWAELPGGREVGRFLVPLRWDPPPGRGPDLACVRRALHAPPGSESEWIWGRAVIGALWISAVDAGVKLVPDAAMTGFVTEAGAIVGIRTLEHDGVVEEVRPRFGILLNSGGFEWSTELNDEFEPGPTRFPQTPPSNDGAVHEHLRAVGVPLVHMETSIVIPGVHTSAYSNDGERLDRIFFQPLAKAHSLVVNGEGRRFANETFFPDLAEAMGRCDRDGAPVNLPCYFVFDQQYIDRYGSPPGVGEGVAVVKADSLIELGHAIGVPPEALESTVLDYNSAVALGEDDLGRGRTAYQRAFAGEADGHVNPTLGTVERAPFHAVELALTTSGHRGGVRVDTAGRVLDADRRPIPGLYACGNVAAGTMTGATYFSGLSLGQTLVQAMSAADDIMRLADAQRL